MADSARTKSRSCVIASLTSHGDDTDGDVVEFRFNV
jgi:hypothetical protein